MDSSTIALLGLVLALLGAIMGSFAYLMGEIRKAGATSRRDLESARDYLNARIEALGRNEAQERSALRTEFVSATGRVEADLRRLAEAMVRRSDVEALEHRLTRSAERLEQKFDAVLAGTTYNRKTTNFDPGMPR